MTTHERVIGGGEVALAVVDHDPGRPDAVLVVMLHGTSANRHGWDAVTDAITEPARVIQVDQRGHGLSGDGDTYDADAFTDDAALVIRSLGRGPAIVVGHSMGARNGWVLAAREPDLVAAVIALDYTPFVEAQVLDALESRVAGGDRAFGTLDDVREYLRGRYPLLPEDAIERRAVYGYAAGEGGLRPLVRPAALAGLIDGRRTDFPDEFASCPAPIVAVRGEHSAIVTPEAWARAQALAPDVEFIDLPAADHYVHEEQPNAVASIIDDQIRAVRQRTSATTTTSEEH